MRRSHEWMSVRLLKARLSSSLFNCPGSRSQTRAPSRPFPVSSPQQANALSGGSSPISLATVLIDVRYRDSHRDRALEATTNRCLFFQLSWISPLRGFDA